MLTYLRQLTGHIVKAIAAGILVVTLVLLSLPGTSSHALAAPKGTLAETMDLKMTKAAQEFVGSILDEYSDALDDSFSAALKPLKSVTKDLTKQLGKAAAASTSTSADTTTLLPKIDTAKEALDAVAVSFESLVADTSTFKSTLSATPTQLKEAIDTQLGSKFDDLQTAFKAVSEAITQLSQDTAELASADPADAVTTYTESATVLTDAIESAKLAIAAFGD